MSAFWEVKVNGAQWVVRTLRDRGVEYVFALPGNGLAPLLDACLDFDIKVVDVRNEQAASYMADTWGRFTRRLGVAMVSSGPGHTNALTGLANSFWDGGPMLLISGCSTQSLLGADAFQELDQEGMAAPVCKYAGMVHHIEALPQQVNAALLAAVSGRPGPVHLTIPTDVSGAEVDEAVPPPEHPSPLEVNPRCPGDPNLVREAVAMLASAQRPFMVVGSGAFYARAWEPLAEFAGLINLPIVSHIWDRGCIEEAIPQYVGITKCGQVTNSALQKLSEADVILLVGARVDYRVGCGRPPLFPQKVRLIRIDTEPAEMNRSITPDVGIAGDPGSVLGQMIEEARRLGGWSGREWLAEVRASRDTLPQKWAQLAREDVCPVPGIRICREIKRFLDREITLLIDGGNIGQWAHMALFDRHPSHWFTCGASGAVGWGLSGAVAAKLARPDHPLLLLSGDGAAGFNLSEIETALRFGTPYVAVVAHDAAWGIVADGQSEDRRIASQLGEIRFDRVAEALGAKGVFIEDPRQLGPAIESGLRADTVVVIHVPTQMASLDTWEERFGDTSGG